MFHVSVFRHNTNQEKYLCSCYEAVYRISRQGVKAARLTFQIFRNRGEMPRVTLHLPRGTPLPFPKTKRIFAQKELKMMEYGFAS